MMKFAFYGKSGAGKTTAVRNIGTYHLREAPELTTSNKIGKISLTESWEESWQSI